MLSLLDVTFSDTPLLLFLFCHCFVLYFFFFFGFAASDTFGHTKKHEAGNFGREERNRQSTLALWATQSNLVSLNTLYSNFWFIKMDTVVPSLIHALRRARMPGLNWIQLHEAAFVMPGTYKDFTICCSD